MSCGLTVPETPHDFIMVNQLVRIQKKNMISIHAAVKRAETCNLKDDVSAVQIKRSLTNSVFLQSHTVGQESFIKFSFSKVSKNLTLKSFRGGLRNPCN